MRNPKYLTTKWVEQIQKVVRHREGNQCQGPYWATISAGVFNTPPTTDAKHPAIPTHAYRGANIIQIHDTKRAASRRISIENQMMSSAKLPEILNTVAARAAIVVKRNSAKIVICSGPSGVSRVRHPQSGRNNSKSTAKTRAWPTKTSVVFNSKSHNMFTGVSYAFVSGNMIATCKRDNTTSPAMNNTVRLAQSHRAIAQKPTNSSY